MCQHSHILKNELKESIWIFVKAFKFAHIHRLKQETCKKFGEGSDSWCSQVNSALRLNCEWQVMELFSPPWFTRRVQSPSRRD